MGMQRICQSIDQEPERWSSLFDQSVYRSLGSDLTGAMELPPIRIGEDPLGKTPGPEAFLAVEIATAMGGQWTVAWALTGVPDPDRSGSIHNSLASPLEVATGIEFAFMKDTKILEEASRKIGAGSGSGGGDSTGSTGGQGGGRGAGRRPKGQGRGGT
eukprot:3891044-Amphidinium_carterae.1